MEEIKNLRIRAGLTRNEFCDVFGVPYRTLQAWELGVRRCPVYVLRMMEALLDLSERTGGLEAFKSGGRDGKKNGL